MSHQASWVNGFCGDKITIDPCIAILRSFDATPWRLRLGGLQDLLAPHARYTLRKKDGTGWEQVSASEFAKRFGGNLGLFGVLEVLAQQLHIPYVTRDSICHGILKIIPPMLLQRGNFSTMDAAVQKSCSQMGRVELDALCRRVPFVWMLARPDAHSANQRMRAKDLQDRQNIPNCYDMPGCCAAHQGPRCGESSQVSSASSTRWRFRVAMVTSTRVDIWHLHIQAGDDRTRRWSFSS